ncbi:hypothetical protein CC99x_007790 [Candidatus Berkiella cookevillensis]|uniref:Uncharacterized protein n=1 Tax=Candidatus Berkiella cookevillensis TaxID=437022 RepID=A0A0Q9YJJ3_9GAMM|nr:hypothetical protein [Candidatus Berkiella cookevillensis]MCS5708804.1 hypothetical protein [Candidatus Berkiella cookevillensis]
MKNYNVELTLTANTSPFSASIRQAEQELSSRFKQMGSTSATQSKRIRNDFNTLSDSSQRFANGIRDVAR